MIRYSTIVPSSTRTMGPPGVHLLVRRRNHLELPLVGPRQRVEEGHLLFARDHQPDRALEVGEGRMKHLDVATEVAPDPEFPRRPVVVDRLGEVVRDRIDVARPHRLEEGLANDGLVCPAFTGSLR